MPRAGERTRYDPDKGYRVHTNVSSRETKGHIRQHRPRDIAADSCDKRSYRTKQVGSCTKIVVCCPKGKWNPRTPGKNKCSVSPKRHVTLIPKISKCKSRVGCAKRQMVFDKKKRKCKKID